jgi:hypothetical protein
MSHKRKTNRDHAKKSQRPMVEDEVVAAQLEALVTSAITALENYYRRLGLRDRILNLPLMVAALLTLSQAGCGRSQRANPHPGEGRFFMVSSHTSISTSPVSKILDLSGPVVREGIQRITPTTQTGLDLTNSSPRTRKHTVCPSLL